MNNNVQILSTSILGAALVDKAFKKNIAIEERSFIRIDPIKDNTIKERILNLISQPLTVVFTSSNAVKEVINYLDASPPPKWSVYCVGSTTEKLVKESFPNNSHVRTAENAMQLAHEIMSDEVKRIVFFCGDHRRDELPELLLAHGITVDEIVVYKTVLTSSRVGDLYNGIIFFSPSAVDSFFSLNKPVNAKVLFAVGETTEKAIRKYINHTVIVAKKASKEEMVLQLIEYFSESTNNYATIKK